MSSECDVFTPFNVIGILLRSDSSRNCDSQQKSRILRDFVTREVNAFLWFFLIAITAVLISKVVALFKLWSKAKLLPGPSCPSFYGHSKVISRRNLTDILYDSHKKYGPVIKLWLGPMQLLVSVKEPALLKEILVKAEDKLPLTGRAFRLAFGRSSLFASSFEKVQSRRLRLAEKLDGISFQRGNVIPAKAVDCSVGRIQDLMVEESIDCSKVSQHLAFTLLGCTLFGDAFLGWSKATIYEELLMMIAKDANVWASYRVTPFWKRGFWRYQRLCMKLKCLTQDIVQQYKKHYNLFSHSHNQKPQGETKSSSVEVAFDMPPCPAAEMHNSCFFSGPNDHFNSNEEPYGNIMGVMFHGCLTTANLIASILERLATNPEIQEKINLELNRAQKDSVKDPQNNVDNMPLLLATIYESARLLPSGPLLQRCSLKQDLVLKTGITIPAGTLVVVPIKLIQMDSSSWGSDANEFNPYRFLSMTCNGTDTRQQTSVAGENDVDEGDNSFVLNDPTGNAVFLPFGFGARSCVGQKFIIQGLATLFASLLSNYEIKLQSESKTDLKSSSSNPSTAQILLNSKIVFIRRNS
ncbi:tabersonine 16-hydroxylase 1 isoform X1 [Cucumis sativus]|uniref:tabersonine 16-hydroxylase 1 isoform X1 n=1 Tax=Cucumis sativus TaxID=3659 RepID=UPI0005EC35C6|nr:tabersonine 16-hydroxylase 1 isoform X1 [Cucumis sativus]